MNTEEFRELVWSEARARYRHMPWRDEPSFYHVLVSEVMLQQTQVSRALIKFAEFMEVFPTIGDLAAASLADVLRVWTGLGYNRRAKFLWQAAQQVVADGQPKTVKELERLSGIGRNTAGAIMNYVYEVPTPFIETNIRTVYIHHFFADSFDVSDKDLFALVESTIDAEQPRQWFWALMDYGSYLKSTQGGRLNQSRHYKKQSPLKGSVREVRGQIVRELAVHSMSEIMLRAAVNADERFEPALAGLVKDGLVQITDNGYRLVE
jgi:A/G-specific adenine glycosylase